MTDNSKTQLICPDCGFPLVEIGYMANGYEGQPDIPNVWACRSFACGCFMTREEAGESQ
jgi:hypothetical protein